MKTRNIAAVLGCCPISRVQTHRHGGPRHSVQLKRFWRSTSRRCPSSPLPICSSGGSTTASSGHVGETGSLRWWGRKGRAGPAPHRATSRVEVTRMLLQWMKEESGVAKPGIDRASPRLMAELEESGDFLARALREHFDYVSRRRANPASAGLRTKRNHLNYLLHFSGQYWPATQEQHRSCLGLAATWWKFHQSGGRPEHAGKWDAIREALHHSASCRSREDNAGQRPP